MQVLFCFYPRKCFASLPSVPHPISAAAPGFYMGCSVLLVAIPWQQGSLITNLWMHSGLKLKGQAGKWPQDWTMCPCPEPWLAKSLSGTCFGTAERAGKRLLGQRTKQFGTAQGSFRQPLEEETFLGAVRSSVPGCTEPRWQLSAPWGGCVGPWVCVEQRCGNDTFCRETSSVPWPGGWEHCSFFTYGSELYCLMASFTWAHDWLHENEIKLNFWTDPFPVVISTWSVRRCLDWGRETEMRQEKEGEKQQVVHSAYSLSFSKENSLK